MSLAVCVFQGFSPAHFLIIFLAYSFNAHGISSEDPIFIFYIGHSHSFLFYFCIAGLKVFHFYRDFQRNTVFLYRYFPVFSFIGLCSHVYFLPTSCSRCSSFSRFLKWRLRSLMADVFPFLMQILNSIDPPLCLAFLILSRFG